ncbi:XRE family transcriptional regulator [Actinoplanes sp. NBRC 101535]|uniref:XRE family transcriptional regulator n=1 Tax=Actinoplanes sp. NBRC 101535 TaxID=3032196 RepID=UPI002554F1F1|nr:XRE family transcriptional regulator [Actinoplanes sp. NBRC 101535]
MAVRGLTTRTLADLALVADREIIAAERDGRPAPALLRRLAPALGLHRSDLFLIADQPVPDDLAPADPDAFGLVRGVIWELIHVPGAVDDLHRFIGALPRLPRTAPPRPLPPHLIYPAGPGGRLVRLLHNRNLTWLTAAYCLFGLGGGPMLSAATIGVIGRGGKQLTPALLTHFAAFLDIGSRDFTAITGIDCADEPPGPAAALLWDARHLTAGQFEQVKALAGKLRAGRRPAV